MKNYTLLYSDACRYTLQPLGVSVNEKSLFYYTTIQDEALCCYYDRELPMFTVCLTLLQFHVRNIGIKQHFY